MKSFTDALQTGFKPVYQTADGMEELSTKHFHNEVTKTGKIPRIAYWHFQFGEDDSEYELCFEPLLFDGQFYVALYKDDDLLTEKVVVKPGKEEHEDNNDRPNKKD